MAFAAYANNNYGGYGDYDQWSVLTTKSVANNYRLQDSQEFLVQTQGLPRLTEVPQTYVLMLSGLIFLVLIGRRRFKEIGYA